MNSMSKARCLIPLHVHTVLWFFNAFSVHISLTLRSEARMITSPAVPWPELRMELAKSMMWLTNASRIVFQLYFRFYPHSEKKRRSSTCCLGSVIQV
ncbi:hypothetical protein CPB84DRAFT_609829 [Gymnopilus junonius]|uniref:Uncharacterized protein n=1 Tax=Gymnopilus junonius TaxID=109634 RepID=A0A9P5TQM8_GYMJU|nr:hypothetical protein CPB84DRAFT_609829 [Gymnopilus junonius]